MARTTSTTRRQHPTAKGTGRGTRSKRPTSRTTRSATKGAKVDPALQRFLDRFSSSLTAGDGEAVAACFEYPTVIVMSDLQKYGPSQVVQDAEAAARFFAQAPEMYRQRGIEETFPDVRDVAEIGAGLLLVRARFPYIDADGNDMGDGEESAYIVRRLGGDEDPEEGEGEGFAIVAAVTLGTDSDRSEGGSGRAGRA